MNKLIEDVARMNNITPRQAEEQMKKGIHTAYLNRNRDAQSKAMWDELSPDGHEPTIEEFLAYCTKNLIF